MNYDLAVVAWFAVGWLLHLFLFSRDPDRTRRLLEEADAPTSESPLWHKLSWFFGICLSVLAWPVVLAIYLAGLVSPDE